ncbi:MAG: lytic polysaccharide monooxygenase auxiliary activity family 9 protein [Potamolinea sp.]
MNRNKTVFALFIGMVMLISVLILPSVALAQDSGISPAHGWVTSPPSRQDHCSRTNPNVNWCGDLQYEPQSVEGKKGSLLCSGGNPRFPILDDETKPWPVSEIGRSVMINWKNTMPHVTSNWEYLVDGEIHASFPGNGQVPGLTVSHPLTDLPLGRHKILARWNIGDTAYAFYNCIDVNVVGS